MAGADTQKDWALHGTAKVGRLLKPETLCLAWTRSPFGSSGQQFGRNGGLRWDKQGRMRSR